MKVPQNLNNLILQVKLGKITPQQGLNLLVEDIQTFPFLYGLQQYDEEFKSEFILKLLQAGPGFFERYREENGQFKTYIYSLIKYQIQDLLRSMKKDMIREKNVEKMSVMDYEESIDKYSKDEYNLSFVNFKPYKPVKTELPPYLRNNPLLCDQNYKKLFSEKGKERKINKLKKTALVLALKSCYYLTDENCREISKLCNISYESLDTVVQELKDSTNRKEAKFRQIQESRDKSFQLKCMFNEKLNEETNENVKEKLKKNYEYHTKHWISKNEILKQGSVLPSPTNKKLAETLGICERQVGYYLQNAEKIVNAYVNENAHE